MIISYDGTSFQGWQPQPHKKTICDLLQDKYHTVFGERITLIGASRTDSGVHAIGQVASFKSTLNVPIEKMRNAWNGLLPFDVFIRSLEVAPPFFHPQARVDHKIYYYYLFLKRPLPFFARFGWHYPFMHEVDYSQFEKALKLFEGEHDFRAFCKIDEEKDTVRCIDHISMQLYSRYNVLALKIVGKSFLHFQIRRMIGSALDAARGKKNDLLRIKKLLTDPDPTQGGLKAESCGLVLRKIRYSL